VWYQDVIMPVGNIISEAFWRVTPPHIYEHHQRDQTGKYLLCPLLSYFSPEETASLSIPTYSEHYTESIVTSCLVVSIKGIVIINNLKSFIYIHIIIGPLQILLVIYNL
jgi:hypothetical protein